MPHDDEQISKLLRLKRHEQPPAEYFEGFLGEFHKRQRAELLKRSAWQIALEQAQDRVSAIVSRISYSQLSYGGASVAVLLVASLYTANLLRHPGVGITGTRSLAGNAAESYALNVNANGGADSSAPSFQKEFGGAALTLQQSDRLPQIVQFPRGAIQQDVVNTRPRYILDAKPVSYERPSNF